MKNYTSILIFALLLNLCTADICDLCECNREIENEQEIIVKCFSEIKDNITIELDNIQWPSGNISIRAFFNDLKFEFLPKILGSFAIKTINLDNNRIDIITTDPFQHCKNVEVISIGNNSISKLPKDFLKSAKYLRELNIARNSLSTIDTGVLSELKYLQIVDLSYNKLTTLSIEIMALNTVETINLEGNLIFVVQNNDDEVQTTFKNINLSKNKFTMIASTTFDHFQNVETLNLAQNKITNIESEAFVKLTSLKTLNLSNNKLEDLSLILPDSLEHLILANNHIHTWPTHNIPKKLIKLEIQYNNLFELFNSKWTLDNLKTINVSHNAIEVFPGNSFPELMTLDLSNNMLPAVPTSMSKRAPLLDTLILDHNPIEIVEFVEPISLRKLSLRHMPILVEIGENALKNVDGRDDCIDLSISHCSHLAHIHPEAFRSFNICKLDLSYNLLSTLPENLTNWQSISGGIDLQGNPFVCNCTAQWMLDDILKFLYIHPEYQHYLANLRCASPKPFTGHRFVKYYKKKAAFCNPNEAMFLSPYMANEHVEFNDGEIQIFTGRSTAYLVIIITCAVILLLFIILGVYLTRIQRRRLARKNRAYPLYYY